METQKTTGTEGVETWTNLQFGGRNPFLSLDQGPLRQMFSNSFIPFLRFVY